MTGPNCRRTCAAVAVFIVLTLMATYPIIRAPASYAFFNHSDAQLNMWILAWDAHALAHHARDLFDTNIFFPETRTLAYSETLLGYWPLFGPLFWLGGTPALAFNTVIWFSFVASGTATYLLVRHLTGRHWPAIVGGIVYAFVPYRFGHFPQIQLEAMEWIPASFLCLHLFLERGRLRYAAGVGAFVGLQALCCIYYAVFLVCGLIVATPILLILDHHPQPRRALLTLSLVACVTAIALAPVAAEYFAVHRQQGLERSLDEIAARSADTATYLSSPARLHQRLWARSNTQPRDYLFPGLIALLLGAIAVGAVTASKAVVVGHPARPRTIVAVYGTIAIVGVLASFGPDGIAGLSLYRLLYLAGPLLRGLRQVSRFGVLALFGISILAGLGAAVLEGRARRFGKLVGVALACAVFLEVLVAPLTADRPGGEPLVHVPPVPPVYEWLARQDGKFAIVELPAAPLGRFWENGFYVYWSTVHWHGVVDAYSGFAPPSYAELVRILASFPDERSHAELIARQVRYVIVHHDRYKPWHAPLNFDRIARTPWLRQVQRFPQVDVLAVVPGS